MEERKNLFSFIPKVDELLENPIISEKLNKLPRVTILDSIREELDGLRNDIKDGVVSEKNIEEKIKTLPYFIIKSAEQKNSFKLKRVVNATGVIIHTNLGRSLMSEKVMKNIMEVSSNYSNLEYDLELGQRGSRYSHLEEIITRITGGESAMLLQCC